MSDEPTLLLAELRRYADSLTDEGPAMLAALWGELAEGLPGDAVAKLVAERMQTDEEVVRRFRRVKHPRFRMGRHPVLEALHRHREELRAGAVERLYHLWKMDLYKLSPTQIAGEVHRRIFSEEGAPYRRTGTPEEVAEDRIYRVLTRFSAILTPTAVLDLSLRWQAELGRFERISDVIEQVVYRLSMPAYRGFLRPGSSLPSTGEAALRAALLRYPDRVAPSQVESLYQGWKPLFSHLPPARVAGLVAARLGAED